MNSGKTQVISKIAILFNKIFEMCNCVSMMPEIQKISMNEMNLLLLGLTIWKFYYDTKTPKFRGKNICSLMTFCSLMATKSN